MIHPSQIFPGPRPYDCLPRPHVTIGQKNEALLSHWQCTLPVHSPGPAPYLHALAQHRLPVCAGSALSLGCECSLLRFFQQPGGFGGCRLPARQGFCGRSGRGQAGDQASNPARAGVLFYSLPIICVLCFIWVKFVLHGLCVSCIAFHRFALLLEVVYIAFAYFVALVFL